MSKGVRVSPGSKLWTWLWRRKWYFIVGVPLLSGALAPFPIGLGMMYPLVDHLRGHPNGAHGTQPQELVGLWVREESVMYDFRGEAFYLMPDGRVAGSTGMTQRRWHFDDGTLFVDAVSRCGNCYRGNVTTEHTIRLAGANRMFVTNRDSSAKGGISGRYRRIEIDSALVSRMSRLQESADEEKGFSARMVLRAIEHYKMLSKPVSAGAGISLSLP